MFIDDAEELISQKVLFLLGPFVKKSKFAFFRLRKKSD